MNKAAGIKELGAVNDGVKECRRDLLGAIKILNIFGIVHAADAEKIAILGQRLGLQSMKFGAELRQKAQWLVSSARNQEMAAVIHGFIACGKVV